MFEGWASEFIATSLGRFVDVQKDKLRISLWSGSGVLENVRLRSEAFDYLNLPFAIHEGVVGRLRIKIPWGNWLTGSLVVELTDVVLCATERDESEWEEAAVLRREQAGKQADLAAAELAKLSRRMVVQQQQQQQQHVQQQQASSCDAASRPQASSSRTVSQGGGPSTPAMPHTSEGGPPAGGHGASTPGPWASASAAAAAPTADAADAYCTPVAGGAMPATCAAAGSGLVGGSGGFGGGLWAAALQYVSQFLLNRLQFNVRNVHVVFRGRQCGVPFSAGLALDSLSTVPEPKVPKSVLARLYGAALGRHAHAKLARHIAIRGLGFYWRNPRRVACGHSAPTTTAASASAPFPPPQPDDYLISPMDALLRMTVVATGASAATASQSAHHPTLSGLVSMASMAPTLGVGAAEGAVVRQISTGSRAGGTLPVGTLFTTAAAGGMAAPGMHVEVIAGTDVVQMQIRPEQLQSMAQLADDLAVWKKRNRYGRFRPPGWRMALPKQLKPVDAAALVGSPPTARASQGQTFQLQRSCSDPGRINAMARPMLQPVKEEDEGQVSGGSVGRRAAPQQQLSQQQLPDGSVRHIEDWGTSGAGAGSALPSPSPLACLARRAYASSVAFFGPDSSDVRLMEKRSRTGELRGTSEQQEADRSMSEGNERWHPPSLSQGGVPHVLNWCASSVQHAAEAAGVERADTAVSDGTNVRWSHVWRYAALAVLHDIRERRGTGSLRDYLQYKRQYMRLYRRKLEYLRQIGGGSDGGGSSTGGGAAGVGSAGMQPLTPAEELVELSRLEAYLPVADILNFRQLTERALEDEQERERAAAAAAAAATAGGSTGGDDTAGGASAGTQHTDGASPQHRSWLAWGLSGVSGFFMYGSGGTGGISGAKAAPAVSQSSLTDVELAELYRLLQETTLETTVAPTAEAMHVPQTSRNQHHHTQQYHHSAGQPQHPGTGAAGNGGAAAVTAMQLALQVRILRLALNIKGATTLSRGGQQRDRQACSTTRAGVGSGVGSGMPPSAASTASSPASEASGTASETTVDWMPDGNTLISLVLGSTAVALESDGSGTGLQASVGTVHAYDMCTDPGVAECILAQADNQDRKAAVPAARGGGRPVDSLGGPSTVRETRQRRRRGTTQGSWTSLGHLLSGAGARSPGLHTCVSTESWDSDAGHWAMGYQPQATPLALPPTDAWYNGRPVVALCQDTIGGLVDVHVRPLRLLYRARCLAALNAALTVDSSASLEQYTLLAIAGLERHEARVLAMLQHLSCTPPSRKLRRLQIERFDVVLPLEEPPTADGAGRAPVGGSTPGHLTVTVHDIELGCVSGLPPPVSPPLRQPSHSTAPAPITRVASTETQQSSCVGARSSNASGGNQGQLELPEGAGSAQQVETAAEASPEDGSSGDLELDGAFSPGVVDGLQRLMQRKLTPSSTAVDFAQLASSAVGRSSGGKQLPCSVDDLAHLFLYDHWRFDVHDIRVSYGMPIVRTQATSAVTQLHRHRQQQQQLSQHSSVVSSPVGPAWPQQMCIDVAIETRQLPLFPAELHLHGYFSRSRLEQGAGSPASLLRLSLSGLFTTMKLSQVEELQTIMRCLSYSQARDSSAALAEAPAGCEPVPINTPGVDVDAPAAAEAAADSAPASIEASQMLHSSRAASPAWVSWEAQSAANRGTPGAVVLPAVILKDGPRPGSFEATTAMANDLRFGDSVGGAPTTADTAHLGSAGGTRALRWSSSVRSAPTSPLPGTAFGGPNRLFLDQNEVVKTALLVSRRSNGADAAPADLHSCSIDSGVNPEERSGAGASRNPSSPPGMFAHDGTSSKREGGGHVAVGALPTPAMQSGSLDAVPEAASGAEHDNDRGRGVLPSRSHHSMRQPLLPRMTCVLLLIEPLKVTFVLDEDARSAGNGSGSGSVSGGGGKNLRTDSVVAPSPPALIISTSSRTDFSVSYSSGGDAAANATMSMHLRGVQLHVTGQQPPLLPPLAQISKVTMLWSLARTISISSLTVSAVRAAGGVLRACGALSGLRVLGPVGQPGHFLISNGPGVDDAAVMFKYWSAGAVAPPDPALAAATAAAMVASGWWQLTDDLFMSDGPWSLEAHERAESGSGGLYDGSCNPVAGSQNPSTSLDAQGDDRHSGHVVGDVCSDSGGGDESGGGAELKVFNVAVGMGLLMSLTASSSSDSAATAFAANRADEPESAQGSSSSPKAAAHAAYATGSVLPPQLVRLLSVKLHRCAILAASPNRTPFAAASGGAGHLACNALLSVDAISYSCRSLLSAFASPSAPVAKIATSPLNKMAPPSSPATNLEDHQLCVTHLLLYLSDNPDSAYLSPVVLLPELRARYSPATDATDGVDVVIAAKSVVTSSGGGTDEHKLGNLGTAADAGSGPVTMALSLDLGRVEANLQPQQAGVLCSLLSEFSPSQPPRALKGALGRVEVADGQQGWRTEAACELGALPMRREIRLSESPPADGQTAAQALQMQLQPLSPTSLQVAAFAKPLDLAASLPFLMFSAKLSSLTAVLGSDTLSEEVTALFWRDARLSYSRTNIHYVESSMSWREMTLSSVNSRLPQPRDALGAASLGSISRYECGGLGAVASVATVGSKIHASSLAIMYELSYLSSYDSSRTAPVAAAAAGVAGMMNVSVQGDPLRLFPPATSAVVAAPANSIDVSPAWAVEGALLRSPSPTLGLALASGMLEPRVVGQPFVDGGGADGDAEFYSVDGGSSTLGDMKAEEMEVVLVEPRELDQVQAKVMPRALDATSAGLSLLTPDNDAAATDDIPREGRSPTGSCSGRERGISLQAYVSSCRSIAQLHTLPAVYLPSAAATVADSTTKCSVTGRGIPASFAATTSALATSSQAPAAAVLLSICGPHRTTGCLASSAAIISSSTLSGMHDSAATAAADTPLATFLIRLQMSGNSGHRNTLQSSLPSFTDTNANATSSPLHRPGLNSSEEVSVPGAEAEWQRTGTSSHIGTSYEVGRQPEEAPDSGSGAATTAGFNNAAAPPSLGRPHFDVDLSGLHVLISSTQWHRSVDRVVACTQHWRTAAAARMRGRMRHPSRQVVYEKQQQGRQQQRQKFMAAVEGPFSAAASVTAAKEDIPAVDAAATQPNSFLKLLLDLPATASLSVQDVALVAYCAPDLAPTDSAVAALYGAPDAAAVPEVGHTRVRFGVAMPCPPSQTATTHVPPHCLQLEVMVGASLEAGAGGCLDRLTLVLPEVAASMGLLLLEHDPRIGTWHSVTDAWRLALLEGLSCAAVPHIWRTATGHEEKTTLRQGPQPVRSFVEKASIGGVGWVPVAPAHRALAASSSLKFLPGSCSEVTRPSAACPPSSGPSEVKVCAPSAAMPSKMIAAPGDVMGRQDSQIDLVGQGGGRPGCNGDANRSQLASSFGNLMVSATGRHNGGGTGLASAAALSPAATAAADAAVKGKDSADAADDVVVVHALLEASLKHASLYAARRWLLALLGIVYDTLDEWERASSAAARRRACERSDSEGEDSEGEGVAVGVLDDQTLRMAGSPGIAAIAAAAAAATRVHTRAPTTWRRSSATTVAAAPAAGSAGSKAIREQQYGMWPHDVDADSTGDVATVEARFGGPDVLYHYQCNSTPHHADLPHAHNQQAGQRRHRALTAAAAGRRSSKGSGRGGGGGGGGDGAATVGAPPDDWLGVALPLWLPLCCLTLRVDKVAAVVYTDVQGFNLPLFEAAISPLEVQLKLTAPNENATTTAVAAASGSACNAGGEISGVDAEAAAGPDDTAPVTAQGKTVMRHMAVEGDAAREQSSYSSAGPSYARQWAPRPPGDAGNSSSFKKCDRPKGDARSRNLRAMPPGDGSGSGGGGGAATAARSSPSCVSAVHVVLDSSLLLDVYNLNKLGWEPVLEPWVVQVLYTARHPSFVARSRRAPLSQTSRAAATAPARPPPPPPPRHLISFTTHTLLEATMSPGLIPAALAAIALMDELQRALAGHTTATAVDADGTAPAVGWVFRAGESVAGPSHFSSGVIKPRGWVSRPPEVVGAASGAWPTGSTSELGGDPCVSGRFLVSGKQDALPRLWLQNHLGQAVSFTTLEQQPRASYLAAVGAHGAVVVVNHGSQVVVDSVPQVGQRFAGRHVAINFTPQEASPQQQRANCAAAATMYGSSNNGSCHARGLDENSPSSLPELARSVDDSGANVSSTTTSSGGGDGGGNRVLCFRLYGGSTWLGPIPCSAAPPSRFYYYLPPVTAVMSCEPYNADARAATAAGVLAPPPGLRLVCDVRPHYLCSRRLVLRSNVRMRNESGLWLELGDWAVAARGGCGSGGGSSKMLLHTLAPGGSTWLSTGLLQQNPVVLAVRTAPPTAFAGGPLPTVNGSFANATAPDASCVAASTYADAAAMRSCSTGGGSSTVVAETRLHGGGGALGEASWTEWSTPVDLSSMLFDAVSQGLDGPAGRSGITRRVYCTLPRLGRAPVAVAADETDRTCHLIVHLAPAARGAGSGASKRPEWELVVMAPIVLWNSLPVPARFALQAFNGAVIAAATPAASASNLLVSELRHSLSALSSLHLHAFPVHRLVSVACRLADYAWSSGQPIYGRAAGDHNCDDNENDDGFEPLHPGLEPPPHSPGSCGGLGNAWVPYSESAVLVRPTQTGLQNLLLVMRTWRHGPTGQVQLELSCPVWIYNCIGMPVQLRPTARLTLLSGQRAPLISSAAASETLEEGALSGAGSTAPAQLHVPGLTPGGDDIAWVPACISMGGAPTLAAASGPLTSQLAALQAAAGLFVGAGRGSQVHGAQPDLVGHAGDGDAMSSSGGCAAAVPATIRSNSSVHSQRSTGGYTIASSSVQSGVGGGGRGGHAGSVACGGGGSSFGSTGLLAALAYGGSGGGLDSSVGAEGLLGHDMASTQHIKYACNADGAAVHSRTAPASGPHSDQRKSLLSPLSHHQPHYQAHQRSLGFVRHPSLDQITTSRVVPIHERFRTASPSGIPPSATEQAGGPSRSRLQYGSSTPGAAAAAPAPLSMSHSRGPHRDSDTPMGCGGGVAEAVAAAATSSWGVQLPQPCMYGSMPIGIGQLELSVWHGGAAGWSPPIWPEVDGSPLHIILPCPLPDSDGSISPTSAATTMTAMAATASGKGGARGNGRPAFHVVARVAHVTAPAAPGHRTSSGTISAVRSVALHLLPRYVVHNGLSTAVQIRQQGTSATSSLGPGERQPVHWADIGLPLKLQIRIQDPGWSWSGGVALDAAGSGDLFVKIRHRNRAETQLVRLDVSLSAVGTTLMSISHHHTDFAPYRIDNCSGEVLHVQQVGCLDQEDVIRPYACLPYTLDEHTAPQRVLVSLPGRRRLGEYELEKVGLTQQVTVVASQTGGHGRKNLLITVTADGPTRVLKVVDTAVHPTDALPSTAVARGSAVKPTLHQSSSTISGRSRGSIPASAANTISTAAVSGEEWQVEVTAAVAGVAVSVVSERAEVLYLLAQGLQGTLMLGPAKVSVAVAVQHVRWDNCMRGAAFPIVLYSPVGRSMFNTAVLLPMPPLPGAAGPTAMGPPAAAAAPFEHRASRVAAASSTAAASVTPPSHTGGAVSLIRKASAVALPFSVAAASGNVGHTLGRPMGPPPAPSAVTGRIVVWRNRPGGVTCVQYASLTVAPLAVSIEETHLRDILRLAAHFAAATGAATPRGGVDDIGGGGENDTCHHDYVRSTNATSPLPPVAYVPDLSQLRPSSPGSSHQGGDGGGGHVCGGGGGGGGNSNASGYAAMCDDDVPRTSFRTGRVAAAVPTDAGGALLRGSVVVAELGHSTVPIRPLLSGGDGSAIGGAYHNHLYNHHNNNHNHQKQHFQARHLQSEGGSGGGAVIAGSGPVADGKMVVLVPRSRRIYIEELHIGEIRISTSFAPRPYGGGGSAAVAAATGFGADNGITNEEICDLHVDALGTSAAGDGGVDGGGSGGLVDSAVRLAVSLAHLEGGWVLLRPLEMRYALMRNGALVQNVCRHYMSCALMELIKLVGSLDIFGDVVRLLQGLGLGVWHLISMPVAGALRGDMRKFVAGLAGGVGSLVRSVAYAASNSVVKASRRAKSTLASLAPEPLRDSAAVADSTASATGGSARGGRVSALQRGHGCGQSADNTSGPERVDGGSHAGSSGGGGELVPYGIRSVWEGYAAILQRVAAQASRLNPTGTARELVMGGLGAVALPSMAVLQLVEVAAASLRAAVSPGGQLGYLGQGPHGLGRGGSGAVRPRIPRHVDPSAPLQRYCWLEAMCRLLLREVRGGSFAGEVYVGGVQISESTFGVVTRNHLLMVSPRHPVHVHHPPEWRAVHPSDLALSLVLPLEGLVLASQQPSPPPPQQQVHGDLAAHEVRSWMEGGRGRVVCIAHLQVEDMASSSHPHAYPHHHRVQNPSASSGASWLQQWPPPQPPAIAVVLPAARVQLHASTGGNSIGGSSGGATQAGGSGGGWTGALFGSAPHSSQSQLPLPCEGGDDGGGDGLLLSLNYRHAKVSSRPTTPPIATAAWGSAAAPGGSFAFGEGGRAAPLRRVSRLMGHGTMGTTGTGWSEDDDEVEAEAQHALRQPRPWLCITSLELLSEADAALLVMLLEDVRRWYDSQRAVGGCRMIGF